ncbi:BON domain-containing protein [Marinicella litoralis]|nr:BON domain-containing protein [Marinicella litoralis]
MSEEIAQINAIRKLLDNHNQFSQKISEVLDQATDLTIQNNPNFQKKFSKIDSKAYVRAIKANKQTFIDALLPIIGPMIRQSVTSAIRRFVSDVNRAMEMGFSAKALKWRWQSLRTGVPFAELVFNNTIAYQVQQIFLIDNETGLLIEYAGQEGDLLQDKEAMSAMLTAIQDFVKDSIDKQSAGLSAAELGDKLLWLIQGNVANLAVVVKGAPTNRLRDQLTDACGELHSDFNQELTNQEKWNNNPELKLQLEQLLLTKSQSEEQQVAKSTRWWPWALMFLLLFGWLSWSSYQKHKTYNDHLSSLNQTPGLVLQDFSQRKGQYIAKGLADPNTDLTQLSPDIKLETTPFISLDDNMIQARVAQYLSEPDVIVTVNNGMVTLAGLHPDTDSFSTKIMQIELLPGVKSIQNQLTKVLSLAEQLDHFLTENPTPDGLNVELRDETILLSGLQLEAVGTPYLSNLASSFPNPETSSLQLYSPEALKAELSSTTLPMVQTGTINANQLNTLRNIHQKFNLLYTDNNQLKLKLSGKSDCQGSIEESNTYAANRAATVKQQLLEFGLSENTLISVSDICRQVSDQLDTNKLGVWFEVVE